MSLTTHSKFYYGFDITTNNNQIDFDEGAGELTAEVDVDSYTATEFAAAIQTAFNAAGTFTYTVTFDRSTQKLTIASVSGNFSLLPQTGTNSTIGPWSLMGFTTDTGGAATYLGDTVAGSQYTTQFILQDHIPTSRWKQARAATVNKTANGRIELIKFGEDEFLQANFRYITDITQPAGGPIISNASGVVNFTDFMDYLITKGPCEFMADKDTPATFEKVILESSPSFKDGTGFKLKELYDINLPEYYESGNLVFRVVE